ncbi:hypothetical protein LINPERHAP1_LOCUS19256 [Linum perenne]
MSFGCGDRLGITCSGPGTRVLVMPGCSGLLVGISSDKRGFPQVF